MGDEEEPKESSSSADIWKAPPEWRKGTGRYRRRSEDGEESVLGDGAYAEVVLVVDLLTKIRRARKRQMYKQAPSWQLLSEIRTLQQVQGHRGVVELLDICHRPGVVDIIMPAYWGSLQDVLDSERRGLPPETIKNLSLQILCAISYVHRRGIAHRDVKPANLLLSKEGAVKLADFGLAAEVGQASGTAYAVGTPGYCPPESMMGSTAPTFAGDTWAVGCVFAEMWLGRPVFIEGTEEAVIRDVLKFLGHKGGPMYPRRSFVQNSDIDDSWAAVQADYPKRLRVLPPLAQQLVMGMLLLDPIKRPHMSLLLQHAYFTEVSLPSSLVQDLLQRKSHPWSL
ncbi:hypothetical protein OC835_004343 [Tilletia horrida]|nr:hypothetical protein OC835_004343 [Tilletia horrida]